MAWDEGLHLDVHESRPLQVAAQDVRIRRVAHRDHGREPSTAQLAGHEELAGIAASALVLFGHDGLARLIDVRGGVSLNRRKFCPATGPWFSRLKSTDFRGFRCGC